MRPESLLPLINNKLNEIPAHRDRSSQHTIQLVTDELQGIVKVLQKQEWIEIPKARDDSEETQEAED